MFEDIIEPKSYKPCICTVGFDPKGCSDYEPLDCEHPLFGDAYMCRWNKIEITGELNSPHPTYKSECMKYEQQI